MSGIWIRFSALNCRDEELEQSAEAKNSVHCFRQRRRTMSIYTALHNLAIEWHAAREEARTRRMIASLPVEVQKDIGWPDSVVSRTTAGRRDLSH
jgi:hypothetical protein